MEAVIIKADQNFFVSILTSVCCNVLELIWNEKLGMKPSPSVPKTLHSKPTFAQNVHPYGLSGLFYPQKSAPICTGPTGQLQKRPFSYQHLHRMSIHTSHPSNASYGNTRTGSPQGKEIQIMFSFNG